MALHRANELTEFLQLQHAPCKQLGAEDWPHQPWSSCSPVRLHVQGDCLQHRSSTLARAMMLSGRVTG